MSEVMSCCNTWFNVGCADGISYANSNKNGSHVYVDLQQNRVLSLLISARRE